MNSSQQHDSCLRDRSTGRGFMLMACNVIWNSKNAADGQCCRPNSSRDHDILPQRVANRGRFQPGDGSAAAILLLLPLPREGKSGKPYSRSPADDLPICSFRAEPALTSSTHRSWMLLYLALSLPRVPVTLPKV